MTWDAEDNDLGYRVMKLRDDLDDLAAAIDDLPARLGGFDGELDQVRHSLRQVETRSADLDATSRDLVAQVKRLGARVEWLERNIRLHAATEEVPLDDVDPLELRLAEVAESGHVARAELLPPSGRSALEAAIDAHVAAVRAHTHLRDGALAACAILAETRWDGDEHAQAVIRYRECVADLDGARSRAHQLAAAARDAANALEEDEQRQVAVADVVAAGETAWAGLQARLRVRVADAVGEGALLPTWFTAVLGPIPPAQDTRPWMDVATSLLAYRVTYVVTDPVLALGREPGPEETARRRAWHHQLRRQLTDLQR